MTVRLGGALLLVGAGKMGSALLQGWLDQGLEPETIAILDPQPSAQAAALAAERGIGVVPHGAAPPDPAVVVLAVKPQTMPEVLPTLRPVLGEGTVVLSIAAGTTLASLEQGLGAGTAIVRSMPNTPAAVGRGITVACANKAVSDQQAERCGALLSAVGEVAWVDEETLLDPVTALSGSGPAYVFLLTECMAEAGVAAGLDEPLARRLARATVSGAGELMRQSDLEPGTLRENVTSPGGTTAAALDVLMGDGELQALITRAILRAAERSRELSS